MSSLEMSGMKEEEEEDTNIYDTLMQSCRTDPTALTVLNKIFDMEIVKNEQEISKLSKRYIKNKGITEGMCKRRGCIAILLTKEFKKKIAIYIEKLMLITWVSRTLIS